MTKIIPIACVWIALWVLSAGAMQADWRHFENYEFSQYQTSACGGAFDGGNHRGMRKNLIAAWVINVLPPAWVAVFIFTGAWEDGFDYSAAPIKGCENE